MTSGRNHNQRSVDSCTSCLLRRTWNSNARAERNIFRVRLPYMNRVTDRAPLVSPSSARSRHPICRMLGLSQPAAAAGTHQTFCTSTRPWTRTRTFRNVWIVPAGRSCWYAPNILVLVLVLGLVRVLQEKTKASALEVRYSNVWIVPAGRSCWYAPNISYSYSSLDSYQYFQENKASALEVRYSMFGLSQPAAAAGTHQTFLTI